MAYQKYKETFGQYLRRYYYRGKLQDYCLAHLSYSGKMHNDARYYQRRFFSPFSNSTDPSMKNGNFTIFDSTDFRQGHHYDMWKDHSTGEAGDIYKLILKKEHLGSRSAVEKRLEELYGKVPEYSKEEMEKIRMEWSLREEKRNQRYREQHFGRTAEEERQRSDAAQRLREAIEVKVLETLSATGALTGNAENSSLPPMPVQIGHKDKRLWEVPMTSGNYLNACQIGNDDPRYMTYNEIKFRGWKLKEGAVPYTFEYMDNKKETPKINPWKLYNAKDVIGIPPYKDEVLSEEEITENIKKILKANGYINEDQEQALTPEKSRELLHEAAKKLTWNKAKIPGQRALEAELLMGKMLHMAGDRTPYVIQDYEDIARHLTRDQEKNSCKNLFESGIGMDKGMKKAQEELWQYLKSDKVREQQRRNELKIHPFPGLSIQAAQDIHAADGSVIMPKGAVKEDAEAYEFLADALHEDKRLFDHRRKQGYGRPVNIRVSINGQQFPVRLEMGKLNAGNCQSVADMLEREFTRTERDRVYQSDTRQSTIKERLRLKAYKNKTVARDLKNQTSQNTYIQKALWQLEQEYEASRETAEKLLRPLREEERLYLGDHPAAQKKLERKADTYQYIVPGTVESTVSGTMRKVTEQEIMKAYESDTVLSIRTLEGKDRTDHAAGGYVVELNSPLECLEQDRNDCFINPGRPGTERLPARPYRTPLERQSIDDLEKHFTVKQTIQIAERDEKGNLKLSTESTTFVGEEARQAIAWAMQDDRDMYETQKSGEKPITESLPQHLTVSYRGQILMDTDIYPGELKTGTAYTPGQLLWEQKAAMTKLQQNALSEMEKGFRASQKYQDSASRSLDQSLELWEKVPEQERTAEAYKDFRPKGMEMIQPKVGQTAENEMKYYEVQSLINYCKTDTEKADYIVNKLAAKMNEKAIMQRFSRHLPYLAKAAEESVKRPEIQKKIAEQKIHRHYVHIRRKTEQQKEKQRGNSR